MFLTVIQKAQIESVDMYIKTLEIQSLLQTQNSMVTVDIIILKPKF
jgi:hypothetical protein